MHLSISRHTLCHICYPTTHAPGLWPCSCLDGLLDWCAAGPLSSAYIDAFGSPGIGGGRASLDVDSRGSPMRPVRYKVGTHWDTPIVAVINLFYMHRWMTYTCLV